MSPCLFLHRRGAVPAPHVAQVYPMDGRLATAGIAGIAGINGRRTVEGTDLTPNPLPW